MRLGAGLRSLRSLRSQPQSQRLGSPTGVKGRVLALRAAGRTNPLTPAPFRSGGRVKARAATPKGHGLDADGTTNAQARGQVEQSERRGHLHPCHVANGQAPLGARQWGCNDRREAQGEARRARPQAAATAAGGHYFALAKYSEYTLSAKPPPLPPRRPPHADTLRHPAHRQTQVAWQRLREP